MKHKPTRVVVCLDVRHRASQDVIAGVLRFAATHPDWDMQMRGNHPSNDGFAVGADWMPDGLIIDGTWRTREGARVAFEDGFAGHYEMDVWETLGDFPLARDEEGAGYAIAVTVDDAAMGVTEVVRGDDLLPATPPQILLYQALGLPVPVFFHVPLVVGPDGRRLAKRHGDTRIASFREAGVSPERLIGFLARSLGLIENERPIGLRSLIGLLDPARIPRGPLVYQGLT